MESEPLGGLLKQFELDESSTFRLFIKPFMDARTWDEDRIDRCCTHVIRPDGKTSIPFADITLGSRTRNRLLVDMIQFFGLLLALMPAAIMLLTKTVN